MSQILICEASKLCVV